MSPTDSPDTAVERALTSDRLTRIELELENHGRKLDRANNSLDRLVDIESRRDAREEAQLAWDREQRAEARRWWRSALDSKAVTSALSIIGTLVAVWAASQAPGLTAAVPPMPGSDPWASTDGPATVEDM